MAEVIDVNIVTLEKNNIDEIIELINKIMQEVSTEKNIEVRDNWESEEILNVDFAYNIQEKYHDKIISISTEYTCGNAGVYIEKIDDYFCYNIWINHKDFIYEKKDNYSELVQNVLEYICLKKSNIFCVVGKEVDFEFEKDFSNMISELENVDVFILEKNLLNIRKIAEKNKYSEYKYNDLLILYKESEINMIL